MIFSRKEPWKEEIAALEHALNMLEARIDDIQDQIKRLRYSMTANKVLRMKYEDEEEAGEEEEDPLIKAHKALLQTRMGGK